MVYNTAQQLFILRRVAVIKTKIFAHRGASAYRPENTLEALSLAVGHNADGIELDVHLSKDGHVVVAHDERLERVSNGCGLINDHTLEELKRLNFNKLFPDQPECRIPTLGEVYSLVKDTPLEVNVELKTTELMYPKLPKKLLELEREFSMEDRVLYSSFNHYSLLAVKNINPKARIGLLYAMGLVDPWIYARHVSAHAIHPHYSIMAALPETVVNCHEKGIAVNVWTVDEPQVAALMMKSEVDTIITNKPDELIACRDALVNQGRS